MTTKSHGISFVGKLWIQSVPSLPAWTAEDTSRVIFVEDRETVYVGGTAEYGNWIAIGTKILDVGSGIDPVSGNNFFNRSYTIKVQNGNFTLEYDE